MVYYTCINKEVNSECSSCIALQMKISGMANRQVGEPVYWKIFS